MTVRNSLGELVQFATALCVAADFGQLEAERLLLEGGADPDRADGNGSPR